MVQIERQGFGDNGYDGSILFERKIFTERIEGVCICHMVCQQLDGVAVLRLVQRSRERGICAYRLASPYHLGHRLFARDVDGGACLYRCVVFLVNVQRIVSRGCFLGDFDSNRISAVVVVRQDGGFNVFVQCVLLDGGFNVFVQCVLLDVGFQSIRAVVGHGERRGFARVYAGSRRRDRQRHRRFGLGTAAILGADFLRDGVVNRIGVVFSRKLRRKGGVAVFIGRAIDRRAANGWGSYKINGLFRTGDGQVVTVKSQRDFHADLRAADIGGAGNNIQTLCNGCLGSLGRSYGEYAAVHLHRTIDRAALQRQAVICLDIAGDAEAAHVDGRLGVNGNIFCDIVEQCDLNRFHFLQYLLQRFILRVADTRHAARPTAVVPGENRRGQKRQAERERQK